MRALPPNIFAAVMATGIVSLAVNGAGYRLLAHALFWLNVGLYAVLAALPVSGHGGEQLSGLGGADDGGRGREERDADRVRLDCDRGELCAVHPVAVGAVLDRAKISVGAHDVVQPALNASVDNGVRISVDRGRPINLVIVVVTVIEALRAFDIVYIINNGRNGLELLSVLITDNIIGEASRIGYGSAIAVVLLVISLVPITIFVWNFFQEKEA